MFDKKKYARKYYQEHKEQMLQNKKKWEEKHPNWQQQYYQDHKQEYRDRCNEWRKQNPKKFTQSCHQSRARRVERLKAQGCTNPWNVVIKGAQPKYET